jgi:hypothetical protein
MTKELKNMIAGILNTNHDWRLTLLRNWDQIIGDLKSKVHLENVKGDTVVLGVYDACWMQELYMLSPVLIHMINQKLDQPYIKHLRFKRAGKRDHKIPRQPLQGKEVAPMNISLTTAEQRALDGINDPQLRLVLEKFLVRCYRERK